MLKEFPVTIITLFRKNTCIVYAPLSRRLPQTQASSKNEQRYSRGQPRFPAFCFSSGTGRTRTYFIGVDACGRHPPRENVCGWGRRAWEPNPAPEQTTPSAGQYGDTQRTVLRVHRRHKRLPSRRAFFPLPQTRADPGAMPGDGGVPGIHRRVCANEACLSVFVRSCGGSR